MAPDSRQRKTVLIDSSTLVYLVEGEEGSPRREAVERILEDAASSGSRVIASTIVWAELLERPLARGDAELAARYRRLLADSSRIELAVVDVAVAERAAEIRAGLPPAARRSLSEADVIQIATAIELGADEILTNDEAWRAASRASPRCPALRVIDEAAFD